MPGSKPPKTYRLFVERFPRIGEAWDRLREAEEAGPLDPDTRRLVKLAVAIGQGETGPVRSAVRKARDAGIPRDAIEQVVALAASTIGFPATVAVHSWILEALE